jgi:hypothetical protein
MCTKASSGTISFAHLDGAHGQVKVTVLATDRGTSLTKELIVDGEVHTSSDMR